MQLSTLNFKRVPMQIGDRVIVSSGPSYFKDCYGTILALDMNHNFPVRVKLDIWPKPTYFNKTELQVVG